MSPAQKRKRKGHGTIRPTLKALRAKIAKHPNPVFGQMLEEAG